jgi:starch phosphorylase
MKSQLSAQLPSELNTLADLAYNLWWTWNEEAWRLFRAIDPPDWEASIQNPIVFLRQQRRDHLDSLLLDAEFMDDYRMVARAFTGDMRDSELSGKAPVAYFCMEYGLHSSVPTSAGGLGVLAGDHLKEASDLCLPLVAVGLLYRHGFFSQQMTFEGHQKAVSSELVLDELPIVQAVTEDGIPVTVKLEIGEREVQAMAWKLQVGRTPLYLLDTGIEANAKRDQAITDQLYPSDLDIRISQEIVLGVGGVRLLSKLGLEPAVWHMNEGHSAFLAHERVRRRISSGESFERAISHVRSKTVFTTHTPVSAGHERFPVSLVRKNFDDMPLVDLQSNLSMQSSEFSMTEFAIRMSANINAVSEAHGKVAREMWASLWDDREREHIPIHHITNGIHTLSWLSSDLKKLFDHYLAHDWKQRLNEPEIWNAVMDIPDNEVWDAHIASKQRLLQFIQARENIATSKQAYTSSLEPDRLTIGFARRFAAYKRSTLLFEETNRLMDLLNQGVQIVFAGKAHPNDSAGLAMLREVYLQTKRSEYAGKLVFLEDYDLRVAKLLVQGSDLWLNTPLPPNEASGTSGQKAAINGVLHYSTLDGWWPEAFNGGNGWAFGAGKSQAPGKKASDAESLYQVLENEIVPAFQVKELWIKRMKESIRTVAPQFSTRRMLKEYIQKSYRL